MLADAAGVALHVGWSAGWTCWLALGPSPGTAVATQLEWLQLKTLVPLHARAVGDGGVGDGSLRWPGESMVLLSWVNAQEGFAVCVDSPSLLSALKSMCISCSIPTIWSSGRSCPSRRSCSRSASNSIMANDTAMPCHCYTTTSQNNISQWTLGRSAAASSYALELSQCSHNCKSTPHGRVPCSQPPRTPVHRCPK